MCVRLNDIYYFYFEAGYDFWTLYGACKSVHEMAVICFLINLNNKCTSSDEYM